jgi:pimeloyl-ACP methyl ester carboxylesterase
MASPPAAAGPSVLTTKLVRVPHLFGISLSYHIHKPIVGSKPTLILIPSLLATASSLLKQVKDAELQDQCNILVFEPLGHGGTKVVGGQERSWTYWDSAHAFLQGMDALNVKRAFVVGVSQGSFIATRMALLSPDKVCL